MTTLRPACLVVFLFFVATLLVDAAPPLVIIDPGHGGTAVAGSLKERSNSSPNNATSPNGIKEKDLTLEFSRIFARELLLEKDRRGMTMGVMLTREGDVNHDFIERAKRADQPGTACVISIHFNAGGGGNRLGSLSMIAAKERNPNFAADKAFGDGLAAACSLGVRAFIPESTSRGTITDGHLHNGRGSNFFFQLAKRPRLANVPKVFLEIEFMDNPVVERALLSKDREAKFTAIARPMASYVLDYLAKQPANP